MPSFIILLIPLVLYFAMIRPQRQRVAAQRALLNGLGPGDRVVTAGGMIGTLLSVDGERSTVELAPGVVVDFLTPAIVRRLDTDGSAEPGFDDDAGMDVPDDLSSLDEPAPAPEPETPTAPSEPVADATPPAPPTEAAPASQTDPSAPRHEEK